MNKLYLDIETTGLNRENHEVTVVGAYDGEETYQLVKDRDLTKENLERLFERTDSLVTFNGKRFDVPFLKHHYGVPNGIKHIDLMYKAWELNWYGGLKAVEKKIGITRGSGVTDGKKAIELWKRYKKEDCLTSLKKLLLYNREDVENLKIVEDKVLKELGGR